MRGERRKLIAIVMAIVFTVCGFSFTPHTTQADSTVVTNSWQTIGSNGWQYFASTAKGGTYTGGTNFSDGPVFNLTASNWWEWDFQVKTPVQTIATSGSYTFKISITETNGTNSCTLQLFINGTKHATEVTKASPIGTTVYQITTNVTQGDQVYMLFGQTGASQSTKTFVADISPASSESTGEPTQAPTDPEGVIVADWSWHTIGSNGWKYLASTAKSGTYTGGTSFNDAPVFDVKASAWGDYDFQVQTPARTFDTAGSYTFTLDINETNNTGTGVLQLFVNGAHVENKDVSKPTIIGTTEYEITHTLSAGDEAYMLYYQNGASQSVKTFSASISGGSTPTESSSQTSTAAPTTTTQAASTYPGSACTLGAWTFTDAPGTSGWQYFVHANATDSTFEGGSSMNDPLFIHYGPYVEDADYSCMARSPITTVTPGSNCSGTISITSGANIGTSGDELVGASVYSYNASTGAYDWLANATEAKTNVVANTKTTFHINYTAPDTGKIIYILTTDYTPVTTLKFEATHSEETTTTTAAPTTTAEPGYSACTLGAWTFADAPGTSGWQYFVHADSTGSTYKGGASMNDPLFIKYATYVPDADYSCMARSPITTVTPGSNCSGTISITSGANIGSSGDQLVGASVYSYNESTGAYDWLANATEAKTNVVANTKTTFHINYTAPDTGKIIYILTTDYTPVTTLKFEASHSEETTTTTAAPTTTADDWIDVPDATATTVGAWTLFANYAEWAQLQYKNKVSTPTDIDDTLIKVKNPTGWYNWNCTAKLANYCTGKMTAGDSYVITINVNSSMATETGHTIRVAIDNVIYYFELDSGNNALEINGLTYTGSSPDVTFDLSLLSQGTVLDFSSIDITSYEDPSTTVPETTTAPPVVDPEIELTGYQINVSQEGFRMVGQVEPTVDGHSVTEFGFVYGLSKIYKPSTDSYQDTGITDADMEVGASSQYIVSYPTTSTGIIENKMGHSTTATYFARTMTFGKKNKAAFASKYKVRVYAKLDNNEYRYSEKVYNFAVFDIADALYQGCLMNNLTNHEYLYNTILTKVDPDYQSVPFEYSHKVAVPGEKNS